MLNTSSDNQRKKWCVKWRRGFLMFLVDWF
jgi:hypothetical protein